MLAARVDLSRSPVAPGPDALLVPSVGDRDGRRVDKIDRVWDWFSERFEALWSDIGDKEANPEPAALMKAWGLLLRLVEMADSGLGVCLGSRGAWRGGSAERHR